LSTEICRLLYKKRQISRPPARSANFCSRNGWLPPCNSLRAPAGQCVTAGVSCVPDRVYWLVCRKIRCGCVRWWRVLVVVVCVPCGWAAVGFAAPPRGGPAWPAPRYAAPRMSRACPRGWPCGWAPRRSDRRLSRSRSRRWGGAAAQPLRSPSRPARFVVAGPPPPNRVFTQRVAGWEPAVAAPTRPCTCPSRFERRRHGSRRSVGRTRPAVLSGPEPRCHYRGTAG
jgi:hypothetical protein